MPSLTHDTSSKGTLTTSKQQNPPSSSSSSLALPDVGGKDATLIPTTIPGSVVGTATRLRTGTGIKSITKFDNSTVLSIPSSSNETILFPLSNEDHNNSSPSRSMMDVSTKQQRTKTTPLLPSAILSDNEMDTGNNNNNKNTTTTTNNGRKRTNSKTKLSVVNDSTTTMVVPHLIDTTPIVTTLPSTILTTAVASKAGATTNASTNKKESSSGTKRKSMATTTNNEDHNNNNNDGITTVTAINNSNVTAPLGDGLEALTVPMNPLPRLSKAGYTSYGGTYDYEIALVNTEDVPLCTGKPDAIIPGSELTEAEFSQLSTEEQKKQRRLIRNRLSAQMHRQRQRAHIDGMETQITELAVVIEEMRTRMAIARSKCTCGVCDDDILFPPTLVSFQPPHVPGILGYTGPAGEKTEEVRRLVLRGILGATGSAASTASTTGLISSRINYDILNNTTKNITTGSIPGDTNMDGVSSASSVKQQRNSSHSSNPIPSSSSSSTSISTTDGSIIDLNDPNHPQHRKLAVTRRRGLIPFGTLRPSKQMKANKKDKLSRSDDGQNSSGNPSSNSTNEEDIDNNEDDDEEISYGDEEERSSHSSHRTNSMNEDDTEGLDEISTHTGTSETNNTINTNKLSRHPRERSNSRQLKTHNGSNGEISVRPKSVSATKRSRTTTGPDNRSSNHSGTTTTTDTSSIISSSSRSSRTPSGTTSPHPPHQQSRYIRSSSPTPPVDLYHNFLPNPLLPSSLSTGNPSRSHITRASAAAGLHHLPGMGVIDESVLLPPMGTNDPTNGIPLLSVRVPSFDSFQHINSFMNDSSHSIDTSTTMNIESSSSRAIASSAGVVSTDPHGLLNLLPSSPVTVPLLSEADLGTASNSSSGGGINHHPPHHHPTVPNPGFLQRVTSFTTDTTVSSSLLFATPPTNVLLPSISTVPSLPFGSPESSLNSSSSSSSSAILLSRPMALSDSSMLSVDMIDEETGNLHHHPVDLSTSTSPVIPSSSSMLPPSSNDIDPFVSSSVTSLSSSSSSSTATGTKGTIVSSSSNQPPVSRFGSLGTLITTGTLATLGMFGYLQNSSLSTLSPLSNDLSFRTSSGSSSALGHHNNHQHSFASSAHGRVLREEMTTTQDDTVLSQTPSVSETMKTIRSSSSSTVSDPNNNDNNKNNSTTTTDTNSVNVSRTISNVFDSLETSGTKGQVSSTSVHDQIMLHHALSVLSSAANDFVLDTKTTQPPVYDDNIIPSSSASASYSPYIHYDKNTLPKNNNDNNKWNWPYTMLWSHSHNAPLINGQIVLSSSTGSSSSSTDNSNIDTTTLTNNDNPVSVTVVDSKNNNNILNDTHTTPTTTVHTVVPSTPVTAASSSLGFDLPVTTRGISLRASTVKSDPSLVSSSSSIVTNALPAPVPVRIDLGKVANAGKKLGLALAHMVGVTSLDSDALKPSLPPVPVAIDTLSKDDEFMQSVLRLFNQEQAFTTTTIDSLDENSSNDNTNDSGTSTVDHTLIMQHELNNALQAYANAALHAYRKAQVRLARNNQKKSSSYSTGSTPSTADTDNDFTTSSSSSPHSIVPASFVFCPEAIGSLGGLNFHPSSSNHPHDPSSTGISSSSSPGSSAVNVPSSTVATGNLLGGNTQNNHQPTLPLLPSTVPLVDTTNLNSIVIEGSSSSSSDTSKELTIRNSPSSSSSSSVSSLLSDGSSPVVSSSSTAPLLHTTAPTTSTNTNTPPYLLLLVPSDSVQPGFDMNKFMNNNNKYDPEMMMGSSNNHRMNGGVGSSGSSNLENKAGTPHVKVQVGNSTVLDNTLTNTEEEMNNSHPDTDQNNLYTTKMNNKKNINNGGKSGGWIEVGCEVVSLRHVTGVPSSTTASSTGRK